MPALNFEAVVERICARDPRYDRQAYYFLREALEHTQKTKRASEPAGGQAEPRHVTGQELLEGIREFALQQFGPLAWLVLDEWGVRRCEDFGEIVFNLLEHGVLSKTPTDRREDFRGGYDFFEAFRKPFLPPSKLAELAAGAHSARSTSV
jgi:uncharacterized repeat protein (TIGR04138 family)